jgi:hypothetical protein
MLGERSMSALNAFYVIVATFFMDFQNCKKYGQGIHPIAFTAVGFVLLGWIAALIWRTGGFAK